MIRRLRPSDHETLARLWHSSWHMAHGRLVSPLLLPHRSPEAFAERVPASLMPHCLVAERSDTIAGFACVAGDEVTQFFVAPADHGTGVAQLLLRASEELLLAEGSHHACVHAICGNDRAIRFYAKAGWEEAGIVQYPAYTLDGSEHSMTCVRFEKNLASAGSSRRPMPKPK